MANILKQSNFVIFESLALQIGNVCYNCTHNHVGKFLLGYETVY